MSFVAQYFIGAGGGWFGMEEKVIEAMKSLGFTANQAKVHLALIRKQPATEYEYQSVIGRAHNLFARPKKNNRRITLAPRITGMRRPA